MDPWQRHIHVYAPTYILTHTHTSLSSDLHWDSRDQHRVATAVSQRVRFPCHHHPQGPHQGNDPTSNQHTGTLSPNSPMPPCRYQDTTRYFQPITLTRLLKIHDAHRGSSTASVKPKPIQWQEVLWWLFLYENHINCKDWQEWLWNLKVFLYWPQCFHSTESV